MGWFTPTYNWLTDLTQGIGIRADRHTAQDLAFTNGISASLCVNPTVNGQNPAFVPTVPTINVNWGGMRITNAGDGINSQDYATVSQLTGATNSPVWGGTSAGTANAQTITLTPALAAYAAGFYADFIVGNTNTGNVTLNVNALGAKSVLKNGTQQLEPGDWTAGQVVSVCYDGANFQNIAPLAGTLSQTGTQLYKLATGTANAIDVALTPVPGFTAYPNGFLVRFQASNTNTGATTLSVAGIAPSPLQNQGQALNYGDIRANNIYVAIYITALNAFQLISTYSVPVSRNGTVLYGIDGGTPDALAVNFSPALANADLLPGTTLRVKVLNTNTGASTISIGGGATINIVKLGATPLVAGDIVVNQVIVICYDGTNFELVSPLANNVTGVTAGLGLSGGTITTTGTLDFASNTTVQKVSTSSNNAVSTTNFFTATAIPQNTGGAQLTLLSITPKNAGSTLLITFVCPVVGAGAADTDMCIALFQDAKAPAINAGSYSVTSSSGTSSFSLVHRMTAGLNTPTTFFIRYGCVINGSTCTILTSGNGALTLGGSPSWTFTIEEILP